MISFVFLSLILYGCSIIDVALAAPTQTTCNGDVALCNRKYSNISFIGTHDSAFIGDKPSQNQLVSVTEQLNGGIRYLQSQAHDFLGMPRMCHTSCALEDGGPVEDYLAEVKAWMDKNPREVVTLLWTNPDNMDMAELDEIFKKVGAEGMAFVPPNSPTPMKMEEWPTLKEMIDSGKRLVVFIGTLMDGILRRKTCLMKSADYGADEQSVPYLLDEFNYYFETPFSVTDPDFARCSIDRKNKVNNDGSSSMYIVNHALNVELVDDFLGIDLVDVDILVPDRDSADRTNAVSGKGSVGDHVDLCVKDHGRYPNVVLIDFFGKGDPLAVQNRMNRS